MNSLSNHLEDILTGSFETLSPAANSQVYARVYQKLNQVADKLKQTESGSIPEQVQLREAIERGRLLEEEREDLIKDLVKLQSQKKQSAEEMRRVKATH